MTNGASRPHPAVARRSLPAGHGSTVWLVSGRLAVSDAGLPAALHKLADEADLCVAAGPLANVGGLILHGRLKLTWSITVPGDEQLATLVEDPERDVRYRLLNIRLTTFPDIG